MRQGLMVWILSFILGIAGTNIAVQAQFSVQGGFGGPDGFGSGNQATSNVEQRIRQRQEEHRRKPAQERQRTMPASAPVKNKPQGPPRPKDTKPVRNSPVASKPTPAKGAPAKPSGSTAPIGKPNSLSPAKVQDESFKVRAMFVDVEDIDLALPAERLPDRDNRSVVIDLALKQCIEAEFNQMRRDSTYVDNGIVRAEAQPHWENLQRVDEIVLYYENGTTRRIPWLSISLQDETESRIFERHDGSVYPVSAKGWVLFDATNTPNIAFLKEQFLEELAHRSNHKVEMGTLVYTFARQIERLGSSPAASTPRFNKAPTVGLSRKPIGGSGRPSTPPPQGKLAQGEKAMVVSNSLQPKEVAFAEKIVELRGGRFVGPSTKSMPGIDGTLAGNSVSLKQTVSKSPVAVLTHVKDAESQAKNVGYRNVEVFVEAPNVSRRELLDFAPTGKLYEIPSGGTVNRISILTKDGWVTIAGTSGPDIGGFLMGE